MEIQGKIIQILPRQDGIGRSGNPWALQQFIIQTADHYPRAVSIELFGEDRIKNNPIEAGEDVLVDFDIESREFNGRWYTSVRAWRVRVGQQTAPAQQATQEPQPLPDAQPAGNEADLFSQEQEQQEEGSDLPF